ncbi:MULTISPECIES: hypothetical protein [Salinicola]|jgi:hypothetical protein|uniref:hypothetical protein n=1 Tax=Salinicola salarius TaxID=430457 RepID=UPI0026EB30E2|nr:hypothetical protein [Salinicola salarius]
MDRRHYINKYGWEAVSTISIAIIGATLVGWLLTDDISKVFAATALGAGLATLGSAIVIRAGLQAKEDHNE